MTWAYKLMRVRANGTVGSLFINRHVVLPLRTWLDAECVPTPGYKVREGWHALPQPHAPHLTEHGRAWFLVLLGGALTRVPRPAAQGGTWLLASRMQIVRPVAALS